MLDIYVSLLYFISILLIWQFVGYPIFMAVLALTARPSKKDYSYYPFVSIIVPTYNEERVIKKRIDNLFTLNYPIDKYEIIIVDSASTDKTADVVEDLLKAPKLTVPLRLVKEEKRKGKASAINFGKLFAKGDIILVTDANSLFDANALLEMMPHFKDVNVGAVGGRFIVENPNSCLTSSAKFYWDLEYIMRKGESTLDSACLFHGEVNAWRKDIVNADTKMLSEDLDMAIQIRRKGYKIKYEPSTLVYEPAPTTATDQIRQRKRTSVGTIQNLFKHWDYFLFPKDLYSLIIFPSHKALTMFSPFLIFSILILYIIIFNVQLVFMHLILTIIIFALLFISLLFLKSKLINKDRQGSTERFTIRSLLNILYYVLLNEYLVLLAWKDFFLGQYSILWEKAQSTR